MYSFSYCSQEPAVGQSQADLIRVVEDFDQCGSVTQLPGLLY